MRNLVIHCNSLIQRAMGVHDPTPEFWMLLRRIEEDSVPEKAVQWFDSAFENVDAINKTIAEMRERGAPVPTEDQVRALANLHRAACNWLGRIPTEEECRAEMLARTREESPHTAYPTKPDSTKPHSVRKVKHYRKL